MHFWAKLHLGSTFENEETRDQGGWIILVSLPYFLPVKAEVYSNIH